MSRDPSGRESAVNLVGKRNRFWRLALGVAVPCALATALGCQWVTGLSGYDERAPSVELELDEWRAEESSMDVTPSRDCEYSVRATNGEAMKDVAAVAEIRAPSQWSGYTRVRIELELHLATPGSFWQFDVQYGDTFEHALMRCHTDVVERINCPLEDLDRCSAEGGCVVIGALDAILSEDPSTLTLKFAAFTESMKASVDDFLCIKDIRLLP